MRALCLFISILLLPLACARLPQIHTPSGAPSLAPSVCERIFPQGSWQFLHRIEAAPPDGSRQTLLGVMQFTSRNDVHCIMMTLEGLVMLEARYEYGVVQVQRAVPPMDRPGLAEGMVRDLLLVFFAPERPVNAIGLLDGDQICRYALPDGGTQDIRLRGDGHWNIDHYNHRDRLTRTVHSDPDAGFSSLGIPTRLMLEAHGLIGYQLTLTLLEAHPLEDQ